MSSRKTKPRSRADRRAGGGWLGGRAPERSGGDSHTPPPGALSVGSFHEEEALGQSYDWRLLKRLLPWLRPHLGLLGGALLLMPLVSLISLAQPYLIKLAIDASLVERSADALRTVVILYAAALLGEFVSRFGQQYLMQLAGQRTMADLRRATFRHIQRLRVGYFDRTPVGRVVTRVTNDVDSLSEFFGSGAVTAIADLITLVGIVGFMFYLDWELSLVALAALPPLAIVLNVFRRYAREAFRNIRSRIAQLNAYLAEQVQGVAVVQAFGREERCEREYEHINAGYRDANYQAIRFDALLYSVVESVSVASVAIILWFASTRAGLVDDPEAAAAYVGTVVAFYEYIQRFFIPIRDLATKYTIIQSSLASAERIFGLLDIDELDAEAQPDRASGARQTEPAVIEFTDLTFAYRKDHPVLEDVNLRINEGEMVAIVGATGSGKTTLTSLLLRLYEIETGAIRVDGVDVRALDRHALRSQFAVVPQDVFLFSGTVLDNVALGLEADEDAAKAVLTRVGAWDLVAERGGLSASVDERGANFSAGERQLLSFARALYRDPRLLILDEATANIDSETEARLQNAVSEVIRGRTSLVIAHRMFDQPRAITSLVIAHRLSTIRHADRIVVFHKGRIVEQGTHDSLLDSDGVYARLHRLHTS